MNESKATLYNLIVLLLLITLVIAGCSASDKHISEIKGKFVFSSNRLGRVYDVFITEDGKTRLLLEKASQPAWSTNGNMVACAGSNGNPKKYGIWILNSKGNKKEFVETSSGIPGELNWSPDDTKIYYAPFAIPWRKLGDKNKIYFYDFISKTHTKIIELDEKFEISNMRLSPKGDKLLISGSDKHDLAVYLSNNDGTSIRMIRQHGGVNSSWYPDNEHIGYITNVDENRQMYIKEGWGKGGWGYLFRMNINTGETEKLWLCKTVILNLKISRDGKYFYYTASAPGGGQAVFVSPIDNPDKKIQITYPIFLIPATYGRSQDWNPDWYQ